MNPLGAFLDSKTFRLERILPGPIERVWRSLTTPDLLATWFAEADLEPRVGGCVELRIAIEQVPERKLSGHVARGEVIAFDPPRTFEYTWNDENGRDGRARFELTPAEKDVRLAFTM